MAYDNVHPRFLPPVHRRPLLTFGHPRLHYAWSSPVFNACTALLDDTLRIVGPSHRAYVHARPDGTVDTWTYGRLASAVNQLAGGLRELGVGPGSRVMLRFSDVPWAAVAQLAVWRIGAIAVPSAPVETAREVVIMLRDTEAIAVLCETATAGNLVAALSDCPHVRHVIGWPDPVGDFAHSIESLSAGQPDSCPAHPSAPLDASGIYYTGGTTGRPKGCIHTHAAEVAIADLTISARNLDPASVLLCHAPVGHAFGNGEKINFPLRAGGTAVWATRPGPTRMWELIADHGVTAIAGAATMYRMMLLETPAPRDAYRQMVLTSALSSGEVLDSHTFEAWEAALGFPLRNAVGMTPMRHLFIESMASGIKTAPGLSVGAPLPGYEVRLIDEEGDPVASRETPGRLAVRGPTGIAYWINDNPVLAERAAIDVRDGWSVLDDAYTRDEDGWLWFQGRLDDMIVTGGRQVAPIEVEEVLGGHPAVAEVAVVGAPDELRGQVVVACVCVRPGFAAGPQMESELQEFAKKSMAGYKYPRRVKFLTSLPKDGVGKVQRRRIREMLTEGDDEPAVAAP